MPDEGVADEIICDYETNVEFGKKKLSISCSDCDRGGKELKNPVCRSSLINILMDEYNITEIILSGSIEKQYTEDAVELFTKLSDLNREIRNFARRDPVERALDDELVEEKKAKKMRDVCSSCKKNPQQLFSLLEKRLKKDYGKFIKSLLQIIDSDYKGKGGAVCKKCLDKSKDDCSYLLDQSVDISDFILYSAFRLIRRDEPKR